MGRRRNMITAEARSRGENQEPVFAIAATEESWWPSVADSRDARRCDLVSPLPGLNILFITLSQPLRAGLPLCRASRRWTVEEDAVSWLPETFSTELPAGDEPSESPVAFATACRRWSVEEVAVSWLPETFSTELPAGDEASKFRVACEKDSRRWSVEEDAVSWLPETFSTELPAGDEPSEAPAFATASRRWSVEEDAVSSLPLASSRDPPCGRNFEEPVSGFLRVSVSPW